MCGTVRAHVLLVGAFIGKTTLEKNSKNLLKSNLGTFCDLAVPLVDTHFTEMHVCPPKARVC